MKNRMDKGSSKEQIKQASEQSPQETAPGDKKLNGPNRPSV
ncbi:hypothetical protein [Paenibacillus puerhi]|nr:hypothetical protein [Paenibacillus puerhi]